jgi:hypothetical protein
LSEEISSCGDWKTYQSQLEPVLLSLKDVVEWGKVVLPKNSEKIRVFCLLAGWLEQFCFLEVIPANQSSLIFEKSNFRIFSAFEEKLGSI